MVSLRKILRRRPSSFNPVLDYNLIRQAWKLIDEKYVDRSAVRSTKLTYGAITGMVNALGTPGTAPFLDPDMVRIESHYLQGNFSGIGAQIQIKDGHVVILAPLDGSPAMRAGLKTGDIIMKVDGKESRGFLWSRSLRVSRERPAPRSN